MTIRTKPSFTPELLITAPRSSPPVPNSNGRLAVYSVSTYSLDAHTEAKEIKILDLKSGKSTLFSDDDTNASPQWLVDNQLLWTRSVDGGKTAIWTGTAGTSDKKPYQVGLVNGKIANLKVKGLSDNSIAISFTAPVGEDGRIYNAAASSEPCSSAREYEGPLVRYWDTYFEKEQHTLWYTTLTKIKGHDGCAKYALSEKTIVNALAGTGIAFPAIPMDALASASYDISGRGILLVSRDPKIDPAKELSSGLWYVPVPDYNASPGKLYQFGAINDEKYFGGPTLSDDGKSAAFLVTKSVASGIEYMRIFVVNSIDRPEDVTEIVVSQDEHISEPLQMLPAALRFSFDKTALYLQGSQRARAKLWQVDLSGQTSAFIKTEPSLIWEDGSVADFHLLSRQDTNTKLLLSKTSIVDSGTTYIIDCRTKIIEFTWSPTLSGLSLGLKKSMVEEITFKSEGDYEVQAWVVKPIDFDVKKKYPLALLIHGGPNDLWGDAWSTRWNPSVWTGQGYIAVLPNITGTIGFGREFAKAVRGNWGGRPYEDLVSCFSYIENNMPYVDVDRAIAAGASYGGYMINWIAGQPLAKRFKAMVSHDGIFSMYNMLSGDVAVILRDDMTGNLWDNKEKWDKYDPAQFTQNWTTPMLVIHSDKDYRCPNTEGLAVYNVCQLKGIESRFLNFPDENHFVLKPENSLQWHLTVLGWANKYANVQGKIELQPPLSGSK